LGADDDGVWGLCQGSGTKPYQTCIDPVEPAYKCSCPSRKIPCKHAVALLLLWAGDQVPAAQAPDWVHQWHMARAERAAAKEAGEDKASTQTDPARIEANEKAAAKRATQRADRVAGGVAELDQWLTDQVRAGLATLEHTDYSHWDRMAARLVDAQCGGLGAAVRRLATVASSGPGWTDRMLDDLAGLALLTSAYHRMDALPEPLAATVRSRIGFSVAAEDVLSTPPLRDHWQVVAFRDEVDERLTTRRTWLLGRESGRIAMVLAFAAPGQSLAADLVVGTVIDADVCFYPGTVPLRALVATRFGPPDAFGDPSPATTVAAALRRHAEALAGDPWIQRWPMVLRATMVPGERWHVLDEAGDALPLRPYAAPWRLVAAAGGAPAIVVGEWTGHGLAVLSGYVSGEAVRG
jgi:hypothetical protein